MTNIYYSTPYYQGNIGKGLNDFCALVPNDAWICLRDADTLFLTPKQQEQILDIVSSNPDFDLMGCKTNRLRAPYQLYNGVLSDNPNIQDHINIAERLEKEHYSEIKPVNDVVAGMFMLFRKSLWDEIKFEENSIFFDKTFSQQLLNKGYKLGIAQGIYLFHLYRFGKPNPCNYVQHLKSA